MITSLNLAVLNCITNGNALAQTDKRYNHTRKKECGIRIKYERVHHFLDASLYVHCAPFLLLA